MRGSLLQLWSYFGLGLRVYRDTFSVRGRARRLEIAAFYLASTVFAALLAIPASLGLHVDAGSPAESFLADRLAYDLARTAVLLPIFSLTARRIQDFGMPGWLFPPFMIYLAVINEWKELAAITAFRPLSTWGDLAFLVPAGLPSWPWEALSIPIALAILAAWITPGTIGANRYGADPREPLPGPAPLPA